MSPAHECIMPASSLKSSFWLACDTLPHAAAACPQYASFAGAMGGSAVLAILAFFVARIFHSRLRERRRALRARLASEL
jgi:hypothetical protein